MLDRQIVPVITGFIGATATGQPTTLGRGGSDYTASVLGVCADADEVWIWTDVDGLMTADPREVGDARTIPALTYDEAAELSYFGARILHPRMVGPLRRDNIPIRVRNVYRPQAAGSLIQADGDSTQALKAVTTIQGLAVTAPQSGPLGQVTDLVDRSLFHTTGSHVEVTISAQSSSRSFVCFVVPTTAGPDALHTLRRALEEQVTREETEGWSMMPVTVVTVIGSRLDELHAVKATLFQSLAGVRVLAVSQGPSACSFSLVTTPQDAERALSQLHDLIVGAL